MKLDVKVHNAVIRNFLHTIHTRTSYFTSSARTVDAEKDVFHYTAL